MNAIELKDVCKAYSGFCLDHINLTLPSGCVMGLIGENGAGKSTTIKLILDMVHKDSGSITLLGQDNTQNTRLLKEDVGVVMDELGMPDCLNIKQVGNIMANTFCRWDMQYYRDLINRFDLPWDKQFKQFSKGMKMKLAIAIAMSHHSKLLLLDEPTGGLDPVVRDEVVDMFYEFTRDESHSILISSHIVSDLEKLCDYIAFLHRGKLLLCEEKDRLLEEYGVVHGTQQQIDQIDPLAVVYRQDKPYEVQAVVKKSGVLSDMQVSPIGLEELFVFMVKGER